MVEKLKLEITLCPDSEKAFKDFLSKIVEAHVNADCEFPGYEIRLGHCPQINDWTLEVSVGSKRLEIEKFSAKIVTD